EDDAAERQRPEVVDPATVAAQQHGAGVRVDHGADNRDGGVAGEGAVAHRRRGAMLVGQAAAYVGDVAGEDDAADRQRPEVVDPAAVAGAGVAPGDRQARNPHRLPGLDLEDAGDVAAADGQPVGPGAVDLQVVGDVQLAAGQGDRAGQP